MSEKENVQKPSIIGMVTSPVQQFERIRERPLIWGAMVIVIILTVIGGWLSATGLEVDVATSAGIVMVVIAVITGIVGLLLGVLVISTIHMVVSNITQSTVTFKQLFSMNTHILIIVTLGAILNGIVAALVGGDPEALSTSLGSVIHTEGAISGFWNSIEVFSIWSSIVTVFGLQIIAGFSKKLAWAVVIIIFVIGIILSVIGAAMTGMVGV